MVTLFRIQKQGLIGFTLLIAFTLGLSACENKQTSDKAVDQSNVSGEELFSNRPVAFNSFYAVVKLKTAPLFDTAETKNGKAIVTPAQLKVVDDEQAAFLADVAKISPEIKVVYKYRFVLNGFALTGPTSALEKLKSIGLVASVETDGGFKRPLPMSTGQKAALANTWKERNSAKFIGAENLHARSLPNARGEIVPLNGTGMTVAVIDTGIDYTHAMLGGSGSAEDFKAINPSAPSAAYPNKKVVGGIDLVGTEYNAASIDFAKHLPKPDANPLDEGGHGTHVAGTIAGLGDGVETYSGVAPGASLYAVKVFGADGATSDSVVIAGLEFSADPNGDGNPDDLIDVVNMSLGSSFGNAKILYNEAIANLSRGGTVVVASAGNSGDVDYITGAPGISDEAISVAASVDNTDHNWQARAVKFVLPTLGARLSEAVEAAIAKPIDEAGPVQGALVFAGFADKDFSDELKAQLKGKVALMDRGLVAFSEKIRRAQEAGAIGAIVANNAPGAAFTMGGDGTFDIPAVMVTQELGVVLKSEITKGETRIEFQTSEKILKPELIDTITDFSSKGPRSEDSLIKPEISSPGDNIISAEMGGGRAGVKMSGTSMAGPHIAGAMALLKQAHPTLSVSDLKGLLLNRAKTITDSKKVVYPISRQGSGRVQIDESVDAKTIVQPSTLSLGEVAIESRKTMKRTITVRNISKEVLNLTVSLVNRGEGLKLRSVPAFALAAGEEKSVSLSLLLDASNMTELVREMDGWVTLSEGQNEIARVPVLAVARKISSIQASNLVIESSAADSIGAAGSVTLTNSGKNSGSAMLFNLLAQDARKIDPRHDRFASKGCDLQSVGYRIVEKMVDGKKLKALQVAAKVYEPLTQWNMCELTVLIDSNGDQEPEQELAAINLGNVPGLSTPATERQFASVLFDAAAVRQLRRKFEADSVVPDQKKGEENYSTAVVSSLPLTPLDHSTIMIVEVDASLLARRPTGELAIKVATQEFSGSSVESDDFLANGTQSWLPLSLHEAAQSFAGLPGKVTVKAGTTTLVELEKGYGQSPLMVLLPNNLTVFSDLLEDSQAVLLTPKFEVPRDPSVRP